MLITSHLVRLGRTLLGCLCLAFLLVIMLPAFAVAATISHQLVFDTHQLWTLVIGALVPLFTYILNHVGPWLSEPVKAAVLVIVAAVAAALYTALATNILGLNTPTLELVLTGVVAALGAHHLLWKPSGISTLLGGGTNRQVAAPVATAPAAVAPAVAPAAAPPAAPPQV